MFYTYTRKSNTYNAAAAGCFGVKLLLIIIIIYYRNTYSNVFDTDFFLVYVKKKRKITRSFCFGLRKKCLCG